MKWLKWLLLVPVLALLVVGGAATGLVPITASDGHWKITEWFLHFAMRRSVVTHALGINPPATGLGDPQLVLRGAGHYESGCRQCHGAPGDRLPPIPAAMTPHPPDLRATVPTWRSRELFYIVKHGVKMTGMPAWPAPGRDDEVWAVVAFLQQLPDMTPERYRELTQRAMDPSAAAANDAAPDVVVNHCARCHGVDSAGVGAGAFPRIAGQRMGYLQRALDAYAAGSRHSGIMQPVAASISAEERAEAARFYAALAPAGPLPGQWSEAVVVGVRLAREGNPRRAVPACGDCHLPGGAKVNDAYPLLAGQYPAYLRTQLRLMQSRARGGSEYLHLMHTFVDGLDEQDIVGAAAFFATQGQALAASSSPSNSDNQPRGSR